MQKGEAGLVFVSLAQTEPHSGGAVMNVFWVGGNILSSVRRRIKAFFGIPMRVCRIDSAALRNSCVAPWLLLFLAGVSSCIFASPASGKNTRALTLHASTGGKQSLDSAKRLKLATGEYAITTQLNEGGVGPFDPAVYDFHEYWTLWRTADGGYEVEGRREFEAPKYEFHSDSFLVRLTRDWRLESIEEFAKLRWRPDSGPLVCNLGVAELHCTSNAKDPSQLIKLDMALEHPFGFLWPISPFSLTSIANAGERIPGQVFRVQVITIEEPNPANPVVPTVIDGGLRYLGKVDVTTAGRKWKANECELSAALHPKFLILTAPEGFLVDLIVEGPTSRDSIAELKLVRYKQYADFRQPANH